MGLYSPESEKSQLNMNYIGKDDSQSIFRRLNQNLKASNNNNDSNKNGLNMSDYSNNSPYGRSYDVRINQNSQNNGNGCFSGSIDSLVDEHIIPSPPLSPKLESKISHNGSPRMASSVLVGSTPKGAVENVLFVKPVWPNGLSRKGTATPPTGFCLNTKFSAIWPNHILRTLSTGTTIWPIMLDINIPNTMMI